MVTYYTEEEMISFAKHIAGKEPIAHDAPQFYLDEWKAKEAKERKEAVEYMFKPMRVTCTIGDIKPISNTNDDDIGQLYFKKVTKID